MAVAVCRQFGAAAHRIWSVFVCRDELVGVGRNAHDANDQQQGGRGEEAAKLLAAAGLVDADVDQQPYGVCEYHNGQVVCYLQVVGLDLHAERECEEGGTEDGLRQP